MEITTLVYDKRNAAIAVAFLAVLGVVVALLTSHLLTVDWFGGVHGFSIGTNNWYCSVEYKLPVVTCEHAR